MLTDASRQFEHVAVRGRPDRGNSGSRQLATGSCRGRSTLTAWRMRQALIYFVEYLGLRCSQLHAKQLLPFLSVKRQPPMLFRKFVKRVQFGRTQGVKLYRL